MAHYHPNRIYYPLNAKKTHQISSNISGVLRKTVRVMKFAVSTPNRNSGENCHVFLSLE